MDGPPPNQGGSGADDRREVGRVSTGSTPAAAETTLAAPRKPAGTSCGRAAGTRELANDQEPVNEPEPVNAQGPLNGEESAKLLESVGCDVPMNEREAAIGVRAGTERWPGGVVGRRARVERARSAPPTRRSRIPRTATGGDQKGHPGCEPTQGPGKYRERPEHQDDQQVGDQGLHDQRQEREHAGDGIRPGIAQVAQRPQLRRRGAQLANEHQSDPAKRGSDHG